MKMFKARGLTTTAALLVAAAVAMPALAQKTITVRQQDFGNGINTVTNLLVQSEGLAEKHGVDLKVLPPIFNAAGIANVVMQGQADIGFGGATAIISLIQQKRPVKIVAVIGQTFEAEIGLTNAALATLAKKGITPESPFKQRLEGLKGLRFASPASGSSTDQVIRYAFKQFGIDPNRDVVMQPLPDLASIIGATRQGAVDGLMGTHGSGPLQIDTDKSGRIFIEFQKEDKGLEVAPQHVLFATEDYMKNNGEAIRRYLTAHLEAKNIVRKGMTQAQRDKLKEKFFRDMALPTFNSLLDSVVYITKGPKTPTQAQLDVLVAINNVTAETPIKLTYDQLFDKRFAEAVEKR